MRCLDVLFMCCLKMFVEVLFIDVLFVDVLFIDVLFIDAFFMCCLLMCCLCVYSLAQHWRDLTVSINRFSQKTNGPSC